MKSIRLLLFDLGGVLLENNSFSRLSELQPKWKNNAELKDRWLASTAIRAFETGKISEQDFARQFIREWELPLSESAFIAEFITWPRDYFPGAQALVQALRKKYRVACLSNSNALHWKKFNHFSGMFDVTLSSHLLGLIKPDPEVFRKALEICDVRADSVVFFDDSLSNVRVATEIGMRAFHVEGLQQVKDVLLAQNL